MTQHTPGPWRLHPDEKCCVQECSESNPQYPITVAQAYGRMGVREANARLIAAAPDLLAALKDVLLACADRNNSLDSYPEEFARARAVIRKADPNGDKEGK